MGVQTPARTFLDGGLNNLVWVLAVFSAKSRYCNGIFGFSGKTSTPFREESIRLGDCTVFIAFASRRCWAQFCGVVAVVLCSMIGVALRRTSLSGIERMKKIVGTLVLFRLLSRYSMSVHRPGIIERRDHFPNDPIPRQLSSAVIERIIVSG